VTYCSYRGRQPAEKGPRQVPERDESSAPRVSRLRGETVDILHDSSRIRRLVAQPVLRVPKPDA
jgi:hypothetical protein